MIITDSEMFDRNSASCGSAVALGYFDGLHLAHRKIIDRVVAKKKDGLCACVHTFSAPPKSEKGVKILTPPRIKACLLSQMGVDFEIVDEFSENFMHMPPEAFFKTYLVEALGAKFIAAGYDYRFGYRKEGSRETLLRLGKTYGVQVEIIEPVALKGQVVSSTMIRKMLERGDVKEANQFLGYRFCVSGQVQAGRQIGRTMNLKTANLKLEPLYALPKSGVYVTLCRVDNHLYKSLTNVGINPTVGGTDTTIETHILDFNGEIYGKEIFVEFFDRIRDEIHFPDKNALRRQIESDIAYTRTYPYDSDGLFPYSSIN